MSRQPSSAASALCGAGSGRLIDGFAEGIIERLEFAPRVADLRARMAQLEERRAALAAGAEARRDLTLVTGRLEDFSTKVRANLDLLDWAARRDVIRLMVRRLELNDGQIEIVFRILPPSGGAGGDRDAKPRQGCTADRGTGLRLDQPESAAGQGCRGYHRFGDSLTMPPLQIQYAFIQSPEIDIKVRCRYSRMSWRASLLSRAWSAAMMAELSRTAAS
jgi:hypothetical protein